MTIDRIRLANIHFSRSKYDWRVLEDGKQQQHRNQSQRASESAPLPHPHTTRRRKSSSESGFLVPSRCFRGFHRKHEKQSATHQVECRLPRDAEHAGTVGRWWWSCKIEGKLRALDCRRETGSGELKRGKPVSAIVRDGEMEISGGVDSATRKC